MQSDSMVNVSFRFEAKLEGSRPQSMAFYLLAESE
jgi:hypothetical protein